jgi:hypothetical protein
MARMYTFAVCPHYYKLKQGDTIRVIDDEICGNYKTTVYVVGAFRNLNFVWSKALLVEKEGV